MSGFVDQERMAEASPSATFNVPSTSSLSTSNTSSAPSERTVRFSPTKPTRVRKESKYIENSRQDKLFSRLWLPAQENSNPKVRIIHLTVFGHPVITIYYSIIT